jgi:hypothetical protein
MAKTPAEVLRKTKVTEKKDDKDDKTPRRNSLLDFIAKNKKAK